MEGNWGERKKKSSSLAWSLRWIGRRLHPKTHAPSLPFTLPFLTERVRLIYTFHWKLLPLTHTRQEKSSYHCGRAKASSKTRASKSELEDVVFLVGWSAAIYKLYSEVFLQSVHILGIAVCSSLPRRRLWGSSLFRAPLKTPAWEATFVLRSILCMVCGYEGMGVPSNVPVIKWVHVQVMQQYLIESNIHVIQIYMYCTKCETFPFSLLAGNLFTKENAWK